MSNRQLIPVRTLCSHYDIEVSFVTRLYESGLIEIEIVEQDQFIDQDQVGDLEKMIRLHHELNVNLEGIDVVLNLLKREKDLIDELNALRNRLRLYEND